jgi:GTP-binding protein
LGHAFLKHIERTKTIIHMLDMYPMDESDPVQNYRTIRAELEAFSPALANKREIIAANKMDLAIDDDALNRLMNELPDKEIFPISGATRQGVESVLETIWNVLQEAKEATPGQPGDVPAVGTIQAHSLPDDPSGDPMASPTDQT